MPSPTIIFDLDGTLVDSVASSRRAWGAFARRRGLDEEETHRFAMGRPTRETVALLVPAGERRVRHRAPEKTRPAEQEELHARSASAASRRSTSSSVL